MWTIKTRYIITVKTNYNNPIEKHIKKTVKIKSSKNKRKDMMFQKGQGPGGSMC